MHRGDFLNVSATLVLLLIEIKSFIEVTLGENDKNLKDFPFNINRNDVLSLRHTMCSVNVGLEQTKGSPKVSNCLTDMII